MPSDFSAGSDYSKNNAMPPIDDDYALLHRYAARRCEDSFRQLVARHLDLVYSAAFRQTHATHHA